VAFVDQGDIEARLRAALRDAMKARDLVAAFALRSALGAIGNAEAVPADPAGEVARRPLGLGREAQILRAVLEG
jgi:hypothetical protein